MSAIALASRNARPDTGHWISQGVFGGFGARHLALALLVPAIIRLVSWTAFLEESSGRNWSSKLTIELQWLVLTMAIGLVAVLSALAVENLLAPRASVVVRSALAVLLASAAGTLVAMLADPWIGGAGRFDRIIAAYELLGVGRWQHIAFLFSHTLMLCYIVVVLFAMLESSHRAGAELHAAQLAALEVQHELVEGELQATQARVDPELLFASLRRIDASYARDIADGQRHLDSLIRFLRAALPGTPAGTSTLARERELVEAHAALAAPEIALEIASDTSLQDEPMPSMLLLPLARWAVDAPGTRSLAIRMQRRGRSMEITLEGEGAADDAPHSAAIEAVRDRLAHLFAQDASLDAQSDGGRRRATLRLPLATATESRRAA